MATYIDAALHIVSKYQMKLFPAYWISEKKQHCSYVKWKSESSNDPKVIKQWYEKHHCYFGIDLAASGYTVIDVDVKNGKTGLESLKALDLPPTLIIKTPSGGYHYYYKGVTETTIQRLGSGVDTPAMVPIPLTNIPGKGSYAIHSKAEIADLPLSILEKMKKNAPTISATAINSDELDLEDNIKKAMVYLFSAPVSIENDNGNDTAYRVSCQVRDFGISQDLCFDLMLKWNDRCEPPWGDDELKDIIDHVYKYAVSPPGAKTAQSLFADEIAEYKGKGEVNDLPRKFSEFNQLVIPQREWLIKDWLPKLELTSISGKEGVGKSLVSLQLATSLAAGIPFLGMKIERQSPVLVVACEDSYDEIHRRLNAVWRGNNEKISKDIPLYLWSRLAQDNVLACQEGSLMLKRPFYKEVLKALNWIDELNGGGNEHKILILDTLADIFAGNENDRTIVNYFAKVVLSSIVKNCNTTVIFLSHPSKASRGTNDVSGSTAWNASVRNRWDIHPHDNVDLPDVKVIQRMKSNYAVVGESVIIQYNSGVYVPVENIETIYDPNEDEKCQAVMNIVTEFANKRQPLSARANSARFIGNQDIRLGNGSKVELNAIKRILGVLLSRDLIVEIKGEKHNNGLWPVIGTQSATIDKPF